MMDSSIEFTRILKDKLSEISDADTFDLIPVNSHEEATRLFDETSDESIHYFVSVKPKRPAAPQPSSEPPAAEIYTESGQLNFQLLDRNARLLIAAGEFELARGIYEAMLKSGTETGKSYLGLGLCLEGRGQLEQAQSNYEEAVTYDPDLESYERLIAILIKRKKDHEAAEVIERALHLETISDMQRFEMHAACGNCWMRLEKVDDAREHYHQALALKPDADNIHSNLGSLFLQAGRVKEARASFEKAIQINSTNHKAHVGRGCCYLAEKKKKEAYDAFAAALEIQVGNPTAIYYLVRCAYELKIFDKTETILKKYVEVAPVNANLMYSLAGIQFHLGKMKDAQETVKRILEFRSDHAGARELFRMLEKTGSVGS